MKVLHVTEYCHAVSAWGTERFIVDLVRGLAADGVGGAVLWLTNEVTADEIASDGIRVLPLAAPPMRVDAPVAGFRALVERVLAAERPDWLHFHTFGLSEALTAKVAQEMGIKCAFTYHSPAWTCRRETGLLFGEDPCDGEVHAWRCSVCQSHARLGGSKLLATAATAVSSAAGWATMGLGATAVRRRTAFFHDNRRYRAALREFLGSCEFTVACAEWSVGVLEGNGAKAETIVHAPQGLSVGFLANLEDAGPATREAGSLCVGYVGRVTEVKGAPADGRVFEDCGSIVAVASGGVGGSGGRIHEAIGGAGGEGFEDFADTEDGPSWSGAGVFEVRCDCDSIDVAGDRAADAV